MLHYICTRFHTCQVVSRISSINSTLGCGIMCVESEVWKKRWIDHHGKGHVRLQMAMHPSAAACLHRVIVLLSLLVCISWSPICIQDTSCFKTLSNKFWQDGTHVFPHPQTGPQNRVLKEHQAGSWKHIDESNVEFERAFQHSQLW